MLVFKNFKNFFPQMYSPTIQSMVKLDDSTSAERQPVLALVTTEFVPWCTRRFTEPILDVIQGLLLYLFESQLDSFIIFNF